MISCTISFVIHPTITSLPSSSSPPPHNQHFNKKQKKNKMKKQKISFQHWLKTESLVKLSSICYIFSIFRLQSHQQIFYIMSSLPHIFNLHLRYKSCNNNTPSVQHKLTITFWQKISKIVYKINTNKQLVYQERKNEERILVYDNIE